MRVACGGGVAGGEFCAAVSFPGGCISGERGTDRADRADRGKGRESAVSGKRVGSSVISLVRAVECYLWKFGRAALSVAAP